MNVRTHLHRMLLGGFAILAASASFGQAAGGNRELKLLKTITLPKPVVINTKKQNPQILKPSSLRHFISENEYVPGWLSLGSVNNLPVGTTISVPDNDKAKIAFPGPFDDNYIPPDCDMAVGPNHVVASVNTTVAFFDKATGKKVFQSVLDGSNFFSGLGVSGEVLADPKVIYDKTSGRWIIQELEASGVASTSNTKGSWQLIAISDTSDPNGTWKKYRLDSKVTYNSNDYWLDYPGIGVTKDAYVWTGNMFGFTNGGAVGAVFVVNKASLMNGKAGTVSVFVDPNSFTIMPGRNFDPDATTLYAMSTDSTSSVRVHAITNLAGTPKVVSTVVGVPSFKIVSRYGQGPGGMVIDTFPGDPRMYTAAYRKGSVYAAHNIMSNDGSQVGVRWYEVSVNNWPTSGTPTLKQSGNIFGTAGIDAHMGAVGINKAGIFSVVYTRSGPSLDPQVVYSARRKSDPTGVMTKTSVIGNSTGSGAQWAVRWGDYFTNAIDPSDETTFWGYGEINRGGGGYATVIGSYKVADPSQYLSFAPSDPVTVVTGTGATGAAADMQDSDGATYNLTSSKVTSLGQVASVQLVFNTSFVSGQTDALSFSAISSLPSTATQQVYVYNWTSRAWVYIGAQPGGTTTETTITEVTKTASQYVSGTGQVKIQFRAIMPLKNGLVPKPFTLNIDKATLRGLPSLN